MSRYIDASIPTADVAELVGEYNGLTAVEQLNLFRYKFSCSTAMPPKKV